jgi:di/tricarboxylate transporter
MALQFGDALLLYGRRSQLSMVSADADLVVLNDGHAAPRPTSKKTWYALGLVALAILVVSFNNIIIGEVMLAAALAMVLGGILSMDEAYRAVEWKSIFLVAGMLPLGAAMTKTGAATLLGNGLIHLFGGWGPVAMLAGMVVVTMLLSQAINGAAVAAIIAPIAIQMAQQSGLDPRAMGMGIALATSLAFLTPLGHPVNILVMGPGGYSFRDYFRVGAPLTLILLVVIIGLLPVLWHL